MYGENGSLPTMCVLIVYWNGLCRTSFVAVMSSRVKFDRLMSVVVCCLNVHVRSNGDYLTLSHLQTAPRVIAPWSNCLGRTVEWVPVSNPASCWVVREDGRSQRFFRHQGPDQGVSRVAPLARPPGVSPPTSAGALPPELIHGFCRFFSLGSLPHLSRAVNVV
jgi:hypothetical protein